MKLLVRSTRSTIQALSRLAKAAGWQVSRDGGYFCIHTPGVRERPIPKKSPRALALLWDSVRHRNDAEDLRVQTAYDPGRNGEGDPDVPQSGLSAWEVSALRELTTLSKDDVS